MIASLIALALTLPAQQATDAQLAAWIADDLRRDTRGTPTAAGDRLTAAGLGGDDIKLARQVSAKLTGAGAHDVIVGVHGGEVVLHGHVADDSHRKKAVELASGIEGVKGVDNHLLLPGEEPAPKSKPAAAPAAPAAPSEMGPVDFITADGLAGRDIFVTVTDGVATLHGAACSEAASNYATAAAMRVPGVRAVRNELDVRRADLAEDRRVALLVQRQLENDPIVQTVSNALLVTVTNGVAHLTGKVRDEGQHARAVAIASQDPSVFAVEDQILVDENLVLPLHGRVPGFKQFRDR
jgi:hyperosmotically inducible periplasmic protein